MWNGRSVAAHASSQLYLVTPRSLPDLGLSETVQVRTGHAGQLAVVRAQPLSRSHGWLCRLRVTTSGCREEGQSSSPGGRYLHGGVHAGADSSTARCRRWRETASIQHDSQVWPQMLILGGDEPPFGAACFFPLTIKRRVTCAGSPASISCPGRAEVLCPTGPIERCLVLLLLHALNTGRSL